MCLSSLFAQISLNKTKTKEYEINVYKSYDLKSFQDFAQVVGSAWSVLGGFICIHCVHSVHCSTIIFIYRFAQKSHQCEVEREREKEANLNQKYPIENWQAKKLETNRVDWLTILNEHNAHWEMRKANTKIKYTRSHIDKSGKHSESNEKLLYDSRYAEYFSS